MKSKKLRSLTYDLIIEELNYSINDPLMECLENYTNRRIWRLTFLEIRCLVGFAPLFWVVGSIYEKFKKPL